MQNTDFTNNFSSLMNTIYSISLYAPLLTVTSMFLFGIFTNTISKVGIYFLWIFVITFIRVIVFKLTKNNASSNLASICLTGQTNLFIPNDITYSTYILTFTLAYLFMPMILLSTQHKLNAINYKIIGFFIAYIILDLFIKQSLTCIPSMFTSSIFGDIISGLGLGAIISGTIMYGTSWKNYLFINEINDNKEVCSMPSKQKFKCSLYKNGELVTGLN